MCSQKIHIEKIFLPVHYILLNNQIVGVVMMTMKFKIAVLSFSLAVFPSFAKQPVCSSEALQQAKDLMTYHANGFDDEKYAAIEDETLTLLPGIIIAGHEQPQFVVLQVMGHVYKSKYQMRLTYRPDGCILLGQEILEIAENK